MTEKETIDKRYLVYYPTQEEKEKMKKVSFEIIDIFDKYKLTKGEKCMIITVLSNAVGMRGAIMGGRREEVKV